MIPNERQDGSGIKKEFEVFRSAFLDICWLARSISFPIRIETKSTRESIARNKHNEQPISTMSAEN